MSYGLAFQFYEENSTSRLLIIISNYRILWHGIRCQKVLKFYLGAFYLNGCKTVIAPAIRIADRPASSKFYREAPSRASNVSTNYQILYIRLKFTNMSAIQGFKIVKAILFVLYITTCASASSLLVGDKPDFTYFFPRNQASISKELGPQLSKGAGIYLPHDASFNILTDRWQRYKDPTISAVVEVATESDIQKTVCKFILSHLLKRSCLWWKGTLCQQVRDSFSSGKSRARRYQLSWRPSQRHSDICWLVE